MAALLCLPFRILLEPNFQVPIVIIQSPYHPNRIADLSARIDTSRIKIYIVLENLASTLFWSSVYLLDGSGGWHKE